MRRGYGYVAFYITLAELESKAEYCDITHERPKEPYVSVYVDDTDEAYRGINAIFYKGELLAVENRRPARGEEDIFGRELPVEPTYGLIARAHSQAVKMGIIKDES